jgi:hypothetical protein
LFENILYETLFTTLNYVGIENWLSNEQTFVVVFLRFKRALWFALSVAQSIVDPSGSDPSDPKPSALDLKTLHQRFF